MSRARQLQLLALALAAPAVACSPEQPTKPPATHDRQAHTAAMGMPDADDPDSDFLKAMIAHHRDAIDLARQELAEGTDPKVRQLAKGLIAAQEAEIARLKAWLKGRDRADKKGQS